MESKYTLIRTREGSFTVPILANKNIFTMILDEESLSFTASIERYFIYYLYVYINKGEVIGWLRDIGKFDWSPSKFDYFIQEFKKLHPKTAVAEYSLELIPMQADENDVLELPIPFYCPSITAQGEKELMRIIIESPREKIKTKITSWFFTYCQDYGYDFCKCKGAQYDWLYDSYMEQHGLSKLNPRPLTPEEMELITLEKKKKYQAKILKIISIIALYIGMLVLFGYLAILRIDSSENTLLWFMCSCVFFILLSFPCYHFLKLK